MNISTIRTILYGVAKYLGDFTAIKRAITSGTIKPLIQRIYRRIYGKLTSRGFNFFN